MKTKNVFLWLAGLILLATIGFNIYQHQQLKKLAENAVPEAAIKEEVTEAPADPVKKVVQKDTPENAESSSKITASDINELEDQLNETEEELDNVTEKLSEELDKKEEFKNARAKLQENILTDMKVNMEKAIKPGIDRDYELLYGRLDLSPEDLEKFKEIVYDWRVANVDRAELLMKATTEEEKEEAYRIRQENRDKYNREFIELMGEEKFKIYDDFKNSRSERSTLSNFMETVPPETRINDSQIEKLVDAMYKVRKSAEIEMGLDDVITFPSDRNEESMKSELELAAKVYGEYGKVSDSILPPGLAEQYKDYLKKQQERYESQFKMMLY